MTTTTASIFSFEFVLIASSPPLLLVSSLCSFDFQVALPLHLTMAVVSCYTDLRHLEADCVQEQSKVLQGLATDLQYAVKHPQLQGL